MGVILPYLNLNLGNLPNEVWVPIFDFEKYYHVSNMGRIKSLKRVVIHPLYGLKNVSERIMKQTKLKTGYLSVGLKKEGLYKTFRVHRLVAIHHICNPFNKQEVNHLKGIKIDNRASELDWATRVENIGHSIKVGLTRQNGSDSNLFGLKSELSYVAKNVNQYTEQGEFIKSWECIEDAVKGVGLVRSSVKRTGFSKGFFWKMNVDNTNNIIVNKKWQRV